MIEQSGLAVFNKAIAETVVKAVCTINGKDVVRPIHSIKVEKNKFSVNVYLDGSVDGTVTNTKLYDKNNILLIQRADKVAKPASKNLLIVFELELSEVSP